MLLIGRRGTSLFYCLCYFSLCECQEPFRRAANTVMLEVQRDIDYCCFIVLGSGWHCYKTFQTMGATSIVVRNI